ncbi:hypothetical protein DICA3_F22122 [Diutina catenulata]
MPRQKVWIYGTFSIEGPEKTRSGGVGFYYGEDDLRNGGFPIVDKSETPLTINRASLWAVRDAMEKVLRSVRDGDAVEPVSILQESLYVRNVMTKWRRNWEKNGYKTRWGKPVANLDLIKPMLAQYHELLKCYRERGWSIPLGFVSKEKSGYECKAVRAQAKLGMKMGAKVTGKQEVWVDGACRGNGRGNVPMSGIGVYYGEGDPRNRGVPLTKVDNVYKYRPTNQRAELIAIREALKDAMKAIDAGKLTQPVVVISDSKYAINALTVWCKKWIANGFKTTYGSPVVNQDLITSTLSLMKVVNYYYKEKGWDELRIEHVSGHSKDKGNDEADRLANVGANAMKNKVSSIRYAQEVTHLGLIQAGNIGHVEA